MLNTQWRHALLAGVAVARGGNRGGALLCRSNAFPSFRKTGRQRRERALRGAKSRDGVARQILRRLRTARVRKTSMTF